MSDTPRTDTAAVIEHYGEPIQMVHADFARQLERDLAAAQVEAKANHDSYLRALEEAEAAQVEVKTSFIDGYDCAKTEYRSQIVASEARISRLEALASQAIFVAGAIMEHPDFDNDNPNESRPLVKLCRDLDALARAALATEEQK